MGRKKTAEEARKSVVVNARVTPSESACMGAIAAKASLRSEGEVIAFMLARVCKQLRIPPPIPRVPPASRAKPKAPS